MQLTHKHCHCLRKEHKAVNDIGTKCTAAGKEAVNMEQTNEVYLFN